MKSILMRGHTVKRYVWKRKSPHHYSADSKLGRWIPLEEISQQNSFATEAEAYAAYGRYALSVATRREDLWPTPFQRLGWLDMKLVAVVPPSTTSWQEVSND